MANGGTFLSLITGTLVDDDNVEVGLLVQPPRAREPNRMAQSTAASAMRSRQRAMALVSGPGCLTVGIWSPIRCRLTGGMTLPPSIRQADGGYSEGC